MEEAKIGAHGIEGIRIKIVRINPDNIRSVPINDLMVNQTENEIFLTFSSFEPPIVFDKADFANIKETLAITRAKFVITREFAEKMVKTLSIIIEKK